MLESIHIQNFQGLVELEIVFDQQITTITGDTDAGKSSSLRAVRWVAENIPYERLIREGAELAKVVLIVDGHEIIRQRGKSDNLYFLDGQEFRAFGVNVPEPIAAILRVGVQNFQGQLDTVFWLQDSAGEVSRRLNAVVDLGIIDKALGEIAGKVRTIQTEVQVGRERLGKAKQRKAELVWIEEADKDYQLVESCQVEKNEVSRKVKRLWGLVLSRRESERRNTQLDEFIVDINQVGTVGKSATQLSSKRIDLMSALQRAKRAATAVAGGVPDVSELLVLVDKYNNVRHKRTSLKSQLSGVKFGAETYRSALIKVAEAEGDLEEATDGTCPVCGQSDEGHKH